ncbi:MAG TPA: 1,4-alpha-glucan branching protein GlgB [Afifellaceae bacterium]|nr:1,4-alpha-glucan branching protein GlgB [Afifellaceae bacterium]
MPAGSTTDLPRETIAALAAGRHSDPFSLLGPHETAGGIVVRTLVPGAGRVEVIDAGDGSPVSELQKIHPDGLFAGQVEGRKADFAYRLRAEGGGASWEFDDPYRFSPVLGEMDEYLWQEGTHTRTFDRFGAHPMEHQGVAGTHFAVWAPSAKRVSVVGDFNHWDGRRHMMRHRGSTGIWEIFLPGVAAGAAYKYEIVAQSGDLMPLKADPIGFAAEQPPRTASVVVDPGQPEWQDGDWMAERTGRNSVGAPISIYEVHLASWRRVAEDGNRSLSYRELADQLVGYAKDMGFTHIELLPVSEHPFDGSWGYQPVGLYAPTSRFGSPEDFRFFVDACHRAGIGLLLDWVPAHFPTDPHGLALFDGTHLYEHADPRQGFHRDWNTLIYNFGRTEVQSFLINNALYWLERFHIDGLRVDAVASMLYLDYSREPGEWIPNRHGGNENLEAIDFLKRMNTLAYREHPGVMTVAEESTAWPGVSKPADAGGLGFGFKWNMGWMNDTLTFMGRDPIHRRYHHNEMTFGIHYGFSENFILPLSHDEVVHGKGSLFGRMPGDEWQKFANLRAYLAFMWMHPGKKLLFMGSEFAQAREWNHDAALDWHLLDNRRNAGMQKLVRDLNRLYRSLPALHELDCDGSGFSWIAHDLANESVLLFERRDRDGEPVVVACNFTPALRENYRIGLPSGGSWREILNTDAGDYGGSGAGNMGRVEADAQPHHGRDHSAAVTLPPLATIALTKE